MSWAWLIHIPIVGILAWLIWNSVCNTDLKPYFWPGLVLKILCGLGVVAIYQWHYGYGDIFFYMESSEALAKVAELDFYRYLKIVFGAESAPSGIRFSHSPRAFFFARAISPLTVLGCDIWLTSVYLSLASFAGLCFLVIRLRKWLRLPANALAFSFFFFPSFVFWSSGLMKESLLMAAIGLYVGSLLDLMFRVKAGYKILAFMTMVIVSVFIFQLKYYYGASLVALTVALIFGQWAITRFGRLSYAIMAMLGIFLVGVIAVSVVHPNLNLHRVSQAIQVNHDKTIAKSSPGTAVLLLEKGQGALGTMVAGGRALALGLFAPYPWQVQNALGLVATLENIFTFCLLASLCFHFIKNKRKLPRLNSLEKLLCLTCIFYILSMAMLLTLASPNFGTLLRYRVGYQPFFILLLCTSNPYFHKIWKKFS